MRSPGDGLLIAPPRAEKVLSKLSPEFVPGIPEKLDRPTQGVCWAITGPGELMIVRPIQLSTSWSRDDSGVDLNNFSLIAFRAPMSN
jgi:hypothetical protein